ncbi:hypothetical protein LF1_01380 [Rubripirellula obstinata]|uniref:Hemerythrin-like domain-containing protein n=1 Tax=Rubripirellula obstinata TaxID=406547 RepID=A0A5B1CDK0_9BACT|nr:hypothetical protein [Rubripirellula obstinata]KAA1257650.1 hypothetical protein LF1_01380 [Rubripirellula obstinata]
MNSVSTVEATSQTTLMSVNPAFLREIKDSNPDYMESVRRIQHICHSPDDPTSLCRNLVKGLDDLRDIVALQFSLEESYGYIAIGDLRDFGTTETPVTRKTARTQAEHRSLYIQLSELAELAEELQYRGVEHSMLIDLSARVCDFVDRLLTHERDEAELIEQTLAALKLQPPQSR